MQNAKDSSTGALDPAARGGPLASWWPYALILLVGVAILLPRLGDFGFWDPWEPKYAQCVREMVERDSYMVPYYRGEARLAKPILTYWSIMAGTAVFGLNEFGARIGGVCAGLASLLGLYYAVSRLRGPRAALLSALVLATLPQFYFLTRQATPDVFLFCGTGLSMLFLCLGVLRPDVRRSTHLAVSYACFAVAVLAKGPLVVGAIFFATLIAFLLARVDWRWFWRPELRHESWTLLVAGVSSLFALLTLGSLAFLFGTSENVWGWSRTFHGRILEVRERIVAADARWFVAEALLLLTLIAVITTAVQLLRRHAGTVRRNILVPAVVLPTLLAVSIVLVGFLTSDIALEITLATGLAALTVVGALASFVWRFLRTSDVWELVGARLGYLGKQLLVFGGIVLLIDGPWYLSMLANKSTLLVNDFIVYNHVNRLTQTINSSGAFDYYWHALAYGFFPWSCLLPVALGLLLAPRGRRGTQTVSLESYLLLGCVVTIAAFSSAVTKFAHYLAPALIPAATLIGVTLDRLLRLPNRTLARLAWATALIGFVVLAKDLLVEFGTIYLIGAFTIKRWVPEDTTPGLFFTGILVVLALIMLASMFSRSRYLTGSLITATFVFSVYCSGYFIPELSKHKTMKHLCDVWKQHRGEEELLGFHGEVKHSSYFYCDDRISNLDSEEFLQFMDPERQAFGIVARSELGPLATAYREKQPSHVLRILNNSHFRYVLVTNNQDLLPTGE